MAAGPWPWAKFKKALASADLETKTPAVVVASGAFSLCHRGHVEMLWSAKERLERAGYAVLGGWLSPWGNGAALEKAAWHDQAKLSSTLRMRVAELTVQDDEFVSIGSWEQEEEVDAAAANHAVAPALQSALQVEFGTQLGHREVQVFLVCGSDEAKEMVSMHFAGQHGRVIVPRNNDTFLEKSANKIFEADPLPGKTAFLSSTKLRTALQSRDMAFVKWAMAPAAVELMFGGKSGDFEIDADLGEFLGEGEPPAEPWPSVKLMNQLAAAPEDKNLAVLVATGAMSPMTRAHVQMMLSAKERMERAGYVVLTSYLLPAHTSAAAKEAQQKEYKELSAAFRLKIAELSCCDDETACVANWEAAGLPPLETVMPKELVVSLRDSLMRRFPLSFEGRTLRAFYVTGTDCAKKVTKTIGDSVFSSADLGVVVVQREDGGDDILMEESRKLIYMADAIADESLAAASSTDVRAAIKANDIAKAAQTMAPAAARFALAPTGSERQQFKADFESLGIAPYKDDELAAARERLKGTLRTWIGPTGTISVQDLERLLKILDPSWTSQELGTLMKSATKVNDGSCVVSDDFIDWVFSCCQQQQN